MSKGKVGEWLEIQFLAWQKDTGHKQTVAAFAKYLDIHKSTYDKYVNGTRKPSGVNLDKIAVRLGQYIYDLLDKPRPDPLLVSVVVLWGKLSYGQQLAIAEEARRSAGLGATRGGERIMAEAQLP